MQSYRLFNPAFNNQAIRLITAFLVCITLVLAGCSKDDDKKKDHSYETEETHDDDTGNTPDSDANDAIPDGNGTDDSNTSTPTDEAPDSEPGDNNDANIDPDCDLPEPDDGFDPGAIEACYRITFTSTWTEDDFPNVPSTAHFTIIAGAVVNEQANLWRRESEASEGLEVLAETGRVDPFLAEIDTAIDNNQAGYSFEGERAEAEDSYSFVLKMNRTFPRITWASMIAPSPDWFVGQAQFDLINDQGEWIETIEIELKAYDAGTETGTTFSLGGTNTDPAEPITRLNETVEGVHEFVDGTVDGKTLAKITYERIN